MRNDLLELWGSVIQDMARSSERTSDFYDLFTDGFAGASGRSGDSFDRFVAACTKAFGREGVKAFNTVLKDLYDNIGVVPRAHYRELEKKYDALAKKTVELEEIIQKLKGRLQGESNIPADLMSQWSESVETFSDMQRQFFREFSAFFDPQKK